MISCFFTNLWPSLLKCWHIHQILMFQYKPYLHIWQYWSLRWSFPWYSNPNPFYSSIANKKGPWLELLIFLIQIQHLGSACKVGLFQLAWKIILVARCHLMWKIILIVHIHHSSLVSDSFRVLSSNLCWTSIKSWLYKLTEYIWMVSVKSSLLFPAATLVFCGLIPSAHLL